MPSVIGALSIACMQIFNETRSIAFKRDTVRIRSIQEKKSEENQSTAVLLRVLLWALHWMWIGGLEFSGLEALMGSGLTRRDRGSQSNRVDLVGWGKSTRPQTNKPTKFGHDYIDEVFAFCLPSGEIFLVVRHFAFWYIFQRIQETEKRNKNPLSPTSF